MGYDLHISRAENWWEAEAHPIPLAAWLEVVAADPDLEKTGVAETATPEGILRYENEGLAVWTGHLAEASVWFDWRRGVVVVKNPDEATIAKMVDVAQRLGARVQGDDGEYYPSGGSANSPRQSFLQRMAGFFRGSHGGPAPAACDLKVGDRVTDFRGQPGTVETVDLKANHGLGRVCVRFDDGRKLTMAAAAHGLTRVPSDPGAA